MPKKTKPRATAKRPQKQAAPTGPIRLQRFLAQAGVGSRRECEELVVEGRVTVDGQVVSKLGSRVDPDSKKVKVDGNRVQPIRYQYFMVHKPTGVLSTCSDPEGRLRVIDLIKTDQRVYNVGRLDKSSEGLILVTNDGELANRLTHPRYGVQKTYHVTVAGNPRWEDLQLLKRGIRLAEAVAKVSEVKIRKRRKDSCDLAIVLSEGRNREIRRLLAHIGHKVTRLRRVAIGSLELGNLRAGEHRRLEADEIAGLKKVSSRIHTPTRRKSKPIETSQLAGQKSRRAKTKSSGGKTGGKSSGGRKTSKKRVGGAKANSQGGKPVRKSKKGSKKKGTKKRIETGSRRGAGRMKKKTPTRKGTRGSSSRKAKRPSKRRR